MSDVKGCYSIVARDGCCGRVMEKGGKQLIIKAVMTTGEAASLVRALCVEEAHRAQSGAHFGSFVPGTADCTCTFTFTTL